MTDKIHKELDYFGIKIIPIEFGKSRAHYSADKQTNSIVKGLASIKFLNETVAEELYELSKNIYNDFIDLLIDIEEKTSCNSRQMEILIKLNFFKRFGKNKKLYAIYEKFKERYKKSHKDSTKQQRIKEIKEFAGQLNDEEIFVQDQILFEKEALGYGQTVFPKVNKAYGMVLDIDTKYSPKVTLYIMNNGNEHQLKVSKQHFYNSNGEQLLDIGDIIKVLKIEQKPKKTKIDGKWVETDIKENWLVTWQMSKKYRQ